MVNRWGAEERRHSAKYSADDAANGGARTIEDALYPLAGSAHDVAHSRPRAPTVIGLLYWWLRRMNNDLAPHIVSRVVGIPRMHIGLLR